MLTQPHRAWLLTPRIQLDLCPPNIEALREVGQTLASNDVQNFTSQASYSRLDSNEDPEGEGIRMKGSIFIFCTNGRARSVVLASVLLVMRGDTDSIEEALEVIRKVRPQICPTREQVQVAREAIALWRDSMRSHRDMRLTAQQQSRPKESPLDSSISRREPSDVDAVDWPDTDESYQRKDNTTDSRKRKYSGEEDSMVDSSYILQGGDDGSFVLQVHRNDLEMVAKETRKSQLELTGGELFGEFNDNGCIVNHTLGPGNKSRKGRNYFVQDVEYLRKALHVLNSLDLQVVGEWHSHLCSQHGEDALTPSPKDVSNCVSMMEGTGRNYILMLAFFSVQQNKVTISAFYFNGSLLDPSVYQQATIQVVEGDEFRNEFFTKLEELRKPSGMQVGELQLT